MDTTNKPKIKIKAVGDTISGIVYVTEKGFYCCPNEPDGEPDYRLKSERFVVVDEF